MNHLRNDAGEWVIAVGAPGSLERVKVARPALIARLTALYHDSCDCRGRAVDRAIEMIREAGVTSYLETNHLLQASAYSNEGPGTVTALVISVGQS